MKKFYVFVLFSLSSLIVFGQGISNSGAVLVISNGAKLNISGSSGNYTNLASGAGTIDLRGDLFIEGNWINNSTSSVFIPGSGNSLTDGNITFSGAAAQDISGNETGFENMNINKTSGSTLNLSSASSSIYGNLTFNTGKLSQSSSTNLKIFGNWTNSIGGFTPGTGTVTFTGTTGTSNINTGGTGTGYDFYNFTVNSSNIAQLGGHLKVLNNFSLNAASQFNCNVYNMLVGAEFINNTSVFNNGTGSVTLTGANNTLGGTTNTVFRVLNINGTYKLVGSNIEIRKSGTGGDLNIGAGAQLVAMDKNISLEGNWNNSGTFSAGSGTVSFIGNSSQSLSGNNTFNNLTINNTGSTNGVNNLIVLNNPVTVNQVLTLTKGIIKADSVSTGNIVNISSSGSSANYGNLTSFVWGMIKKSGNTDFIFPTGFVKSSKVVWAPVGISELTGTTDFYARYSMSASPANWNPGCMTDTLDHTSGKENWDLNGGSVFAKITLYWQDANWSQITSGGKLRVSHWNTTTQKWENMGIALYNGPDANNLSSIKSKYHTTSYSPFTFGAKNDGGNPLPVELTEFSGSCMGEANLIWRTATETNNQFFTLDKSTDGVNWSFLAKLNGAGNSNSDRSYYYTDKEPSDITYYRLTQTDFNGQSKTFEPIMVKCQSGNGNKNISIFPNPFQSSLCLSLSNIIDETVTVRIYDLYGRQLEKGDYHISNGFNNMISIDLGDLPTGVYYLEAKTKDYIKSSKIVKNK